MNTIGDRLKKLRNKYNFTQKQLGDYIGYDQSYIAKLENNKRQLQVDTLDELCILYNCSEEYILEGKNDHDIINFNFRRIIPSLDLSTIADMNRIVRNISFLSTLYQEENEETHIYNESLDDNVILKANDCRRVWNINEFDPIDIVNVCLNKFRNITLVFFIANENMSGASCKVNDEIVIFINSNHTYGRQRFTIAHELYHIIYGENEFVNCSINSNSIIEEQADKFASYLLMSDGALLNYKHENNINNWKLEDIIACEQYFQISRQAILNRLKSFEKDDTIKYDKYYQNIKYNAKKYGFDLKLYSPYSNDENLLIGNYIRLTMGAFEDGLITRSRKDELLRDAFYYDFLNKKNMRNLVE